MSAGQIEHPTLLRGPEALSAADLGNRRELWLPTYCAAVMGVCEETLTAAIENGGIRYTFDFSSAGATRREARIWAPSVRDWIGGDLEILNRPDDDTETMGVIGELLPRPAGAFTAAEAATRWMISKEQALRLLRSDATELKPDARKRLQGQQSPWICRRSAAEFLSARRIF